MPDLPHVGYHRPVTLTQALAMLQESGAVALAGGTDLIVALAERDESVRDVKALVDVKRLPEARGVSVEGTLLRIGALATAATLATDPLVGLHARALAHAAALTSGPALRNRGTLGGNLCTPHPAGDVATALLALDARVEIAGVRGVRSMPVEGFLHEPGGLERGEILLAVLVPLGVDSAFEKFGPRLAFCRAIVSAAVARGGHGLRVALGGVAVRPVRLRGVEDALSAGRDLEKALARECDPPDDETASRAYRLRLAAVLIRRCFAALDDAITGTVAHG